MKARVRQILRDSGNPAMSRRHLLQTLGATAVASFVANAPLWTRAAFAAAEGKVFPAVTMNHLSLGVADYVKSRDWYVDLFGMRIAWDDGKQCALEFGSMTKPNGMYIRKIGPTEKPGVGHFAFGVPNFMANRDAMKAEMERRNLTNIRPDGEVGWIANDPSGYMLNTWVPIKDKAMYPGAAAPCKVAASDECRHGYENGVENLSALPKPSGRGFKALYYSHVVLNVPEADLAKEKEFYTGMYGMKVIYDKEGGPNPEIFLRFDQNTLYLRKTANAGDKPYCNHYAFVVENYNQGKVEAELKRRRLDPKPDSKLGWTIQDPDGMRIEVAGPGLPEHIANDCNGAAQSCPGGDRG